MAEITYRYRRNLLRQVETYTLRPGVLESPAGSIPLRAIRSIRVYTLPGMVSLQTGGQVLGGGQICRIESDNLPPILLSAQHFVGFGRTEDRTEEYRAFVSALVTAMRVEAPSARLLRGMPPQIYWPWLMLFGTLTLLVAGFLLLGFAGMLVEHTLTFKTGGFLLLVLLLGYSPFSFLRATYGQRTRPLGAAGLAIGFAPDA
jgi:hypothetical protein